MQASIVEAKPEITIGVLGQDGHGKTTLTAAIAQYLSHQSSSVVAGDEVVISIEGSGEDGSSRPSVYETKTCRYRHVDFRSHRDIVKNFILNHIPLHGAILVVSAVDGVTSQTREQVRLASIAGVSAIVVFLNQCDLIDDAEPLVKVEQDVRGLLLANGYSDDLIIRGSATAALNNLETGAFGLWASKIRKLLDALDAAIPAPQRLEDKPFLMHIEEVFHIYGKGITVASGWVEGGSLHLHAPIEIVGLGLRRATLGIGFEQRHKKCDILTGGEAGGIGLWGVKRNEVQPGQVLAAPDTIRACSRFRAVLYLPKTQKNGSDPLGLSCTDYVFSIRTVAFNGTLQLEKEPDSVHGEEAVEVTGDLETSVALERGLRFTLQKEGRILGMGIFTELLP